MIRGLVLFALALSGTLFMLSAAAHPSLSEYVQHDVTLEAGAKYLDLTLRLTFFDRHAELQEAFLDRDGDGRFSSAERAAYRSELLKAAEKQLTLDAGGVPLELLPLYDPEITADPPDPAANPPRQFEVRLKFFARLPADTRDGAALAVRDGLFPEFPALAGFHVVGKDARHLTAESDGHNLARPADAKQPLVLDARLSVAPKPEEEGEKP